MLTLTTVYLFLLLDLFDFLDVPLALVLCLLCALFLFRMGAYTSTDASSSRRFDPRTITNEFELVIRVAKELEQILEKEFGATGKGLHQKISSAQGLSAQLVKRMRFLATIRNKMIHDADFNSIPDRRGFEQAFAESCVELEQLLKQRHAARSSNANTYIGSCVIS